MESGGQCCGSCVTDLTRLQNQQVLEKAVLALWAFYAALHIKQR